MYSIKKDYTKNSKSNLIKLPEITEKISERISRMIEFKGYMIDNEVEDNYKQQIRCFFNQIKCQCIITKEKKV